MSASPSVDALPGVPEPDDSALQSWMYRSEAFAEDLDEALGGAAAGTGERGLVRRLTLPLSALTLVTAGVGMALLFGLH